jgi:hypothetical protein
MPIRRLLTAALALVAIAAAPARSRAEESPATEPFANHPAEKILNTLFPRAASLTSSPAIQSTNISKADYLKLIAGNVDFFKQYQNDAGAVIDPYSKSEIQYSTPSFAVAAGILVKEAGRTDLLIPACQALSCSLTALVTHHAAGQHSDFYIPLIMHAYRELKGSAPAALLATWQDQLGQIIPENTYRMDLRAMNWNIVSSSGELMRRKDGFVLPEYAPSQWKYLEDSLAIHEKDMTRFGLIKDPSAPLAYDAFSRLWLDEMMADGDYQGALADRLRQVLSDGALSGLLLSSPIGEWPNGGRSALHNWAEAQTAFICEVHANEWRNAHRDDIAGAFKRAAHLAFQSLQRWQRPTGELWIIKNRAEPSQRLAFESYSSDTQYNLLPMAMLAMAYNRADDSIAERATPSEVGGYVFDVRDTFHKVVAAAGGYYVLIDTNADPAYNATGLQRVHRVGVSFPELSDSAPIDRAFEPKNGPKAAMTPGLSWKNSATSDWRSLADFPTPAAKLAIKSVDLTIHESTVQKVAFDLDYTLSGPEEDGRHLVEQYTLTSDGVDCTTQLIAATPPVEFRAQFPALVSDGAADTSITLAPGSLTIGNHGSTTAWTLRSTDESVPLELSGPRIVTHNGYVQRAIASVGSASLHYHLKLSQP